MRLRKRKRRRERRLLNDKTERKAQARLRYNRRKHINGSDVSTLDHHSHHRSGSGSGSGGGSGKGEGGNDRDRHAPGGIGNDNVSHHDHETDGDGGHGSDGDGDEEEGDGYVSLFELLLHYTRRVLLDWSLEAVIIALSIFSLVLCMCQFTLYQRSVLANPFYADLISIPTSPLSSLASPAASSGSSVPANASSEASSAYESSLLESLLSASPPAPPPSFRYLSSHCPVDARTGAPVMSESACVLHTITHYLAFCVVLFFVLELTAKILCFGRKFFVTTVYHVRT